MGCTLCPRNCGAERKNQTGYCGASNVAKVARAMPHHWEEPCLSGDKGSGTVFFSGCQLKCVYCQNRAISDGVAGKELTVDQLTEVFFRLAGQGVHNINLVTPDPYILQVATAVRNAKKQGLELPFVMNCSGYETVSSLQMLDGLIDIYLPDFKYMSPILAKKYSAAKDYPTVAKASIAEMIRQQPKQSIENGIMQKGVIIRHLLLPGCSHDSKRILAYLHETYGDSVSISIMSQYTPMDMEAYPELNRTVTAEEYDEIVEFAWEIGIRNAFVQDGSAASESFIPSFRGEGVEDA